MKKPQQKRAIVTREKILAALETLLMEREFESLSIAEIACAAGVAVGSVYSHFDDKAALLPALIERRYDRVEQRIATLKEQQSVEGYSLAGELGKPPNLKAVVELILRAAHSQIMTEKGVMRAMMTYRRLNEESELPRVTAMADQAYDGLYQALEPYQDDIVGRDLRSASLMLNHFINVIFLDKVAFLRPTLPAHLNPNDEEKILAYRDMLYSYLTNPPSDD
ncbi:MAG: TetR/AcrR family transcriptional regulator [Pseudomonadota bacterium]